MLWQQDNSSSLTNIWKSTIQQLKQQCNLRESKFNLLINLWFLGSENITVKTTKKELKRKSSSPKFILKMKTDITETHLNFFPNFKKLCSQIYKRHETPKRKRFKIQRRSYSIRTA